MREMANRAVSCVRSPLMAYVHSVNLGSAKPLPTGRRAGEPTGIDKRPVDALDVRAPGPKHGGLGSGAVGDFIGETQHHGGDDQAVYAVAREELDWWGAELGRDLRDGMFGENLTTHGLDVDAALVDEVWQVGEVRLRVAGPRIPCNTFRAHMGEPGWVKRFAARGRSGAYLAVLEPGTIRAGDTIEVVSRPAHSVTVPVAFRAYYGDPAALDQLHESGCGSAQFKREFASIQPRA